MAVDWTKWGVVGYKDDTGIGRMAEDMKRLLGVVHLVVPSKRLDGRPLVPSERLLRPDFSPAELSGALAGLHGIVTIECSNWHPKLIHTARAMGLKVVCVPMWEWFRGQDTNWREVDLFICPSRHALRIVRSYGHRRSLQLPWLLDLDRLPRRRVRGPARIFIHNAGLVDTDDRKGTRETIEAFKRVRRSDIRLIVRLQKPAELPPLDERIEVRVGNLPDPAGLYAEGDVAVQPSKMEGIGFMVLEPVCCGLPVITLDYPPMSCHVSQPELRIRRRWLRRKSFPARKAGIKHAYLRLPCLRDLVRKIEWCAGHDMESVSRANRAWAEAEFAPAVLKDKWSMAVGAIP